MNRSTTVLVIAGLVVVSAFAIPVSAAISLDGSASGDTTQPGGAATVTLTITNNGNSTASGPALDITDYPSNWTISAQGGDGTWGSGDEAFLYLQLSANSSATSTLTFDVPADAAPGDYTVTIDVKDSAGVVKTMTATVTVTSPLQLSGSDAETHPNESATVSFTVENTGSSAATAPALDITAIPTNWTISDHGGDGTWSSSNRTFLYTTIDANSSVKSTVTLDVPAGAELTDYTVSAELIDGDGNSVSTVDVTVSVLRDVEDEYDEDSDGRVEVREVQKGIDDWTKGNLTLSEIRRLIQIWAGG